jgi:large subunit ribosomal protein L6
MFGVVRASRRFMSRIGRVPVVLPEGVRVTIEPYAEGYLRPIKPPTAYRLKQMMKRRPDKDSFQAFGQPHRAVVEGPLGRVQVPIHSFINVERPKEGTMLISSKCGGQTKLGKTMWGTTQSYLASAVQGVSQGYKKELELNGVGFRARMETIEERETLVLRLGFTNELHVPVPFGVQISCPSQTSVTVFGHIKGQVGNLAAKIRRLRKPDAYKGKGIRYLGEEVKLKPGKRR